MFEKSFRSYTYTRWCALFLLALLFAMGSNVKAVSANENGSLDVVNGTIPALTSVFIRLDGEVAARPENGVGEWTIDIGSNWSRTIHVVERTELPDRLPTIGQKVEVHGLLSVERSIVATKIMRRDGSGNFDLPVAIFEGTVKTAPAQGEKIGLWTILLGADGDDGAPPPPISLDIQAIGETRFGGGIPKIGQKVKVWATLQTTGKFVGNDMRLQQKDDDDDNTVEFEGIVLSNTQRPEQSNRWVIESSERLYLVEENGDTKFNDGVPVRGQKVKVKGTQQVDGRVIAQIISIDEELQATRFGIVMFRPATDNHRGLWRMRDAKGRNFAVDVDDKTVFDSDIPDLGDFVVITGIPQRDATVYAKKIHVSAITEEIVFEAMILQRPDTEDGTGEWQVGINRDLLLSVVVDSETEFAPRLPTVSEWVRIKGHLSAQGQIQANEIKMERYEEGELVIRLNSGVVSGTIASRYNLIPRDTLLTSGNIFLFITPKRDETIEDVIEQMENDPDVLWTEPNYTSGVPVGNPYKTWKWGGIEATGYVNQTAFEQVNVTLAHAQYQGKDTVVAVLDTGVDFGHASLAGHLLGGYDMVDDDTDPQDEGDGLAWGHGTHITGIIAQMAPQTQVLPVRVLDTNGRGNTYILAYAVEWAAANGADVINLSLGAEADSQLLRETIATVTAQGLTVVAAAGNSADSTAQYPAKYDGVIGVSAIDDQNVKASFANYGKEWVDIAAPGEGITSTIVGPEGSGFASWSGTSMSTSFVSGAAALVYEKYPNSTATEVATLLIENAADLSTNDPVYGAEIGGLLDVGAALVPDGDVAEEDLQVYIPFIMSE